jgi:hypothetical protein
MSIIQREAMERANPEGIIKCAEEYLECLCDFEPIDHLRTRVEEAYIDITRELAEKVYETGNNNAAYLLYDQAMERLTKYGFSDKRFDPDEIVL